MALNRASEVSVADWRLQIQVKNFGNFSLVEIRFFSVVENPMKHSSYIITRRISALAQAFIGNKVSFFVTMLSVKNWEKY